MLVLSPVGLPGRVIRNAFSEKLADGPPKGDHCTINCLKHCSLRTDKTGFCIARALTVAHKGDVVDGLIFSGSNAVKCKEIVHVKDVIEDLFGQPHITEVDAKERAVPVA